MRTPIIAAAVAALFSSGLALAQSTPRANPNPGTRAIPAGCDAGSTQPQCVHEMTQQAQSAEARRNRLEPNTVTNLPPRGTPGSSGIDGAGIGANNGNMAGGTNSGSPRD